MNRKRTGNALAWMMCGWCLVPWVTHADQALSASARQLGIAESVLHFCSSADPSMAGKLSEKVKELTKGLNAQQVAELRQSAEYQAAYASMEDFVGKVDPHNVKQVCTQSASLPK